MVSYSGYACIAKQAGNIFLADPNLSMQEMIEMEEMIDKINVLQVSNLFSDVLLKTLAQNVVLILDLCYVGKYPEHYTEALHSPSLELEQALSKKIPTLSSKFPNKNLCSIVSITDDFRNYENNQIHSSIFLHFLCRGLMGEATESKTGIVSCQSLYSFVQANLPDTHLLSAYGHGRWSQIILAQHK